MAAIPRRTRADCRRTSSYGETDCLRELPNLRRAHKRTQRHHTTPSALPRQRMSGTTFQCSQATSCPCGPCPSAFVENQQHVEFVAKLTHARQIVIRRHHRAGPRPAPVRDNRRDVLAKIGELLEFAFQILGVGRNRQNRRPTAMAEMVCGTRRGPSPRATHRLAVERARGGNEAGLLRVEPRQFQRAFDGIGAVADEKAILQVARCEFTQ